MKSFIEWCQHYGYDPSSPDAKSDYARYVEQAKLVENIFSTKPKQEKIKDKK